MSNVNQKKIVIFDFDGVLYDSISLVRNDMYQKYPNLEERDFLNMFEGNFWDGVQAIKEKYGEPRPSDSSKIKKEGKLFEGVAEMVNEVGRHLILVINSSSKEGDILDPLEREVISRKFNGIYGKNYHPDKVEKFKSIFADYGVSADDVVFITDTIGDVEDAAILNIDTVAVTWGVHKKRHFTSLNCDCLVGVVNTPKELVKLLLDGIVVKNS